MRATRRAVVLTVAMTLVAGFSSATADAHAPGTTPEFFGVNGAYLRDFVQPQKAATLEGLAASMNAEGVSWARLTFDQAVDNRTRGSFNWYVTDTMVRALARHGVRGKAAFIGTAYWAAHPSEVATCGVRSRPADLAGWSAWVAAAARRYGPSGTFWAANPSVPRLPIRTWEIGNEVNMTNFWCPGPNPEQYAAVYSASAEAITAVDPQAEVIVAGLAPVFGWSDSTHLDVPTFLSRLTAAAPSLGETIPSVAIHPYATTPEGALDVVAKFRQAMRDAGMANTPMLANEIGWYTQGGPGVLHTTEQERAGRIATVANQFWRLDCGVEGLAPYSWITLQQDPSNSEHWFGLTNATTGAPNAGGLAYGEQIELALGGAAAPPPQGTLKVCGATTPNPETPAGEAPRKNPVAPPDTWISKAKVRSRSSTVSFTFGAGGGTGAIHYSCKLDGGPLRPCRASASYRVTRGRHTFQVVAEDELGQADPTPATRTFRIKRRAVR